MIDFEMVYEFKELFVAGIKTSLGIAFASCCIGVTLGCFLGIILSMYRGMTRAIIMTYVTIIRGTPMLIQVAGTYYLLIYAGFSISPLWSAIFSIGLNSAAYMSQIMLGGIKSIPKGQWEASKALGLSKFQTVWHIILPQAFANVIPAFGNELITLVKDSSLASTISVYELTKQGEIVMSQTFDAPTVYIVIGCIYLIITSILSLMVSKLDKKLQNYA